MIVLILLIFKNFGKFYFIECDIGEWCGWSDCDSECGPGQQTRVRTCDCPAGTECPVPTEESRECPEDEQTECAPEPTCNWTPWCNWSDCSGDCGDQTRARSRMCDCGDQPECETKDQDCPGPDLEEEPCVEVSHKQLPVPKNNRKYREQIDMLFRRQCAKVRNGLNSGKNSADAVVETTATHMHPNHLI